MAVQTPPGRVPEAASAPFRKVRRAPGRFLHRPLPQEELFFCRMWVSGASRVPREGLPRAARGPYATDREAAVTPLRTGVGTWASERQACLWAAPLRCILA